MSKQGDRKSKGDIFMEGKGIFQIKNEQRLLDFNVTYSDSLSRNGNQNAVK